MTPGVTQETVDGMSLGKIDRIIEAVRPEPYGCARPEGLHPEKDRETEAVRHATVVG